MPLMCIFSCVILIMILREKYYNHVPFINEDSKALGCYATWPRLSFHRVVRWEFDPCSAWYKAQALSHQCVCHRAWHQEVQNNRVLLSHCVEIPTRVVPSWVLDSCWPELPSSSPMATSTVLHRADAQGLFVDDLTEGSKIPVESCLTFALRKMIFTSL